MKTCAKCCLEKDAAEFTKLSRASDGLNYRCKACQASDRKQYYDPAKNSSRCKRWYASHREEAREYRKGYYESNKDAIKAQASKWYRDNPEKAKAKRLGWYLENRGTRDYKTYMAAAQRKYLANGGRETLQHAARAAVRIAVRAGVMTRLPCEKCGSNEDVQGHHFKGYAFENWFAVQWLCHEHHCEAHGWNKYKSSEVI